MNDENKNIVSLPAEIMETTSKLIAVNKSLAYLEGILSKTFTPEKIKSLLVDLCEASDVIVTKEGDEIKKPNWDARKNGVDRVLKLLKYTNKNDNAAEGSLTPTKIIFNIVNEAPK